MGEVSYRARPIRLRSGVVVILHEKILMMRQNQKPFWVFPGGTVEEGESLIDCAERELMEEASLTINVSEMLYVGELITETRHVLDTFFLGHYQSGELDWTPPFTDAIDEIALFDYKAFSQLAVRPAPVHHAVLEDWPQNFLKRSRYLGKYGS